MIKALKELFNNGTPSYHAYKTQYNVWDNIAEVYTKSNSTVRDYLLAYKGCKQAKWKASQVNEIGTDIDGNPFVRIKQPWSKGTRTVMKIGMVHGDAMEREVTEEYDEDVYITYTKLLS